MSEVEWVQLLEGAFDKDWSKHQWSSKVEQAQAKELLSCSRPELAGLARRYAQDAERIRAALDKGEEVDVPVGVEVGMTLHLPRWDVQMNAAIDRIDCPSGELLNPTHAGDDAEKETADAWVAAMRRFDVVAASREFGRENPAGEPSHEQVAGLLARDPHRLVLREFKSGHRWLRKVRKLN